MKRGPAALHRPLLLLLVLAAGACVRDPEPAVSTPPELAAAHPALIAAWRGTDPAAFRPYFADKAIVVTAEDQFTGWEDIQARWITPALPMMSSFALTGVAFAREGADIVETGRYSFQMTMEGESESVNGIYAQRWQRQPDGSWRVVTINVE
jgi:ketosteroid isomerase-like protein